MLPLSLHFGYDVMSKFLDGARSIDEHFLRNTAKEDMSNNLPLMLGLIGYYNTYICGHETRAILPYSQALLRFPAHIQQVDMESNGKSVTIDGKIFSLNSRGELNF